MAATVKERPPGLIHIKILYTWLALVTVGSVCSIWMCFTEIHRLRRDLEAEVVVSSGEGTVEFQDLERLVAGTRTEYSTLPDSQPHEEEREHKTLLHRVNNEQQEGKLMDVRGQEEEDDDQLLRVKRRARTRGGRSRQGRETGSSGSAVSSTGGSGSAAAQEDNWVWLTSYSRIPMFALQEFCASTKQYCPSVSDVGLPGPPGLPGKKGERGFYGRRGRKGEPGKKGDAGDVGPPGFPGIQGPKGERGPLGEQGKSGLNGIDGFPGPRGDKGDKGDQGLIDFPGYESKDGQHTDHECPPGPPGPQGPMGPPGNDGLHGIPGLPGLSGEPGYNGTDGLPGSRGRRGKPGMPGVMGERGESGPKGDKGDRGLPGIPGDHGTGGNCTCLKGQKGDSGEKGKRGLIGFIGYKGEPGDDGPPGPPGPILEGPAGPPGSPGLAGQKGQKGEPGHLIAGSERRLETTTTTTTTTTTVPSTTVEPTVEPRKTKCKIRMVGKPLFQRYTGTYWGAWMRDPVDSDRTWSAKFWFTRHFVGKNLYEYRNLDDFRQDRVAKTYQLKEMYFGTGHVVYDKSFYYHRSGFNEIIRYDLEKEATVAKVQLPLAAYEHKSYVYSTEYNFFDLAVDENGLWVIYSQEHVSTRILVSKLNAHDLAVEKTWNITVNHADYGNGFIICGVLHLIKDTKVKTTVIDFAYDLYEKKRLDNIRLKFSNPFQMNNMISYNPRDKKIYCWDRGNQLTYPLLLG